MGRGSSRPSARKGGVILYFLSNFFPKQFLKARIQIDFKLEFKSNHSKNSYAAA
jgi:hypothetical protein